MTLLLQTPAFDLHWEPRRGALRLESPGRTVLLVGGVELRRERRLLQLTTADVAFERVEQQPLNDEHGNGAALTLYFKEQQGLSLQLQAQCYPARPFVLLQVRVENRTPEPVTLERFFLRTPPAGLKSLDAFTGSYCHGWQSWSTAGFLPADAGQYRPWWPICKLQGPGIHNGRTPWEHRAGRFVSETVAALISAREALVVGGASLADQFVQVVGDLRAGRTGLRLQSQADGIPLAPGETATSEWFYIEWVPMPQPDPLAQYAYAVARQMDVGPLPPAPLGWCSWYFYWEKVAEADVVENLASAALLADTLPLEIIQLDQGFEPQWGDWTACNERFPHGLPWLAERIAGSGFTPGLWLAPLTAHPRSALARDHPEWLLRNRRGRPVSAGLISHFISRALDPTHPEVAAYLHELIATAVHEWGYRYLKLDFLYAGALPGCRHDPRLTRAQALRRALQIIREAAGDEIFLLGCGAPLGPAVGLVDGMRIGPDTAAEWAPNWRGLRFLLKNNPSAPSLRNSLHEGLSRAWTHGRWWLNDPDALMARTTETALTQDEIIAQATLIGLSGGLLMLSDRLPDLSAASRALVEVLTPPLLEGMDTLDLFQQEMPEVVSVPVTRPWSRWRLLGLFNWDDAPATVSLPRDLPDFDLLRDYHVVDFWERRYFRLDSGAFPPVFELLPHGAVLLGIRPVKPAPHLVATTFHISQGAEISDFQSGPGQLTLRLELGRVAEGEVWVALPARPESATLNSEALPESAIRAVARGVWAVACHLNRAGVLELYYPRS